MDQSHQCLFWFDFHLIIPKWFFEPDPSYIRLTGICKTNARIGLSMYRHSNAQINFNLKQIYVQNQEWKVRFKIWDEEILYSRQSHWRVHLKSAHYLVTVTFSINEEILTSPFIVETNNTPKRENYKFRINSWAVELLNCRNIQTVWIRSFSSLFVHSNSHIEQSAYSELGSAN